MFEKIVKQLFCALLFSCLCPLAMAAILKNAAQPDIPEAVYIDLSKYITNVAFDKSWQVTGLPVGLHYENGVISGKLMKQEMGKHFFITLLPASKDGAKKPYSLDLQVVATEDVPSSRTSNRPFDKNYQTGETITPLTFRGYYNPSSSSSGLFFDHLWAFNSLSLRVTGLQDGAYDSGLTATYTPNNDSGTLTIQGTTSSSSHTYNVKIYASNVFGESAETQDFTITIGAAPETPTVTVAEQPTYIVGERVTNDEIATATAGAGQEYFNSAADITVAAEDTEGHTYPLSDFNLDDVITLGPNNTSAAVDITDISAAGVTNADRSPQNYVIRAVNNSGYSSIAHFTLTVDTEATKAQNKYRNAISPPRECDK
ncbi:MAG: hypothetical protein ABIH77_01765 [Pseudomonadota bacterium]